jgi:glycosyltransferase involved in cell wall biosynthesis
VETSRILYVYPQPFFGFPPWTVCAQIINNLDRQRFQALVVAGEGTEGELGLADPGATPTARFPLASSAQLARSLLRIRRFALDQGAQLVHVNEDLLSMVAGTAVARAAGLPLLVHHHASPRMYTGVRRALLLGGARLAARNVGVSRFIANELLAAGAPRTDWVLNGVDSQRFSPAVDGGALRAEYGLGREHIVVLQLARLWRPKRQEDLVRAFAIAHARVPQLRCLMLGWDDPRYQGPFASYRDELRQLSRDLGVGEEVLLARPRPDAPQIHAACDIFGFPSVDEPCALVVLEALATGKPVVGVRAGGVPELVTDGETGFLVTPGSAEELAERLVRLATDEALRRKMGAAAREAALHRFQLSQLTKGFEAVYEAVLRGKDHRPFGQPGV